MQKFELVIPAHNEEEIIEDTISNIYNFLSDTYPNHNWALTIANNKSTDRTNQIVLDLIKKFPRLKLVYVHLQGKGHAVYEAWKQSDADIIAFTDADFSIDVSSITTLLNTISDEHPVAIASRRMRQSQVERDWVRSFTSGIYNRATNFMLKTNLSDHQCGLKAIKRELFVKVEPLLTERKWFFDTELLYTLRQNNINIKEVPIIWRESLRQSRVTSIKDNSIKGFKLIWSLKNKSRKMNKWPKKLLKLSEDQIKIKDDFMKLWHEVLPNKYQLFERFNHTYPIKFSSARGKILEIGAGLGEHISYEQLADLEYYAIELRPDMAKVIKEKFPQVKVTVGDCQARTIFEDNFFDRVNAIHVLEHLPNLPATLKEVNRILKPNGQFAVVIPCEGGLAYSLGRKISAQRLFEKKYKMKYDFFIKTEHINLPDEIFEELEYYFTIQRSGFFPFIIPSIQINLGIGLILKPKK